MARNSGSAPCVSAGSFWLRGRRHLAPGEIPPGPAGSVAWKLLIRLLLTDIPSGFGYTSNFPLTPDLGAGFGARQTAPAC